MKRRAFTYNRIGRALGHCRRNEVELLLGCGACQRQLRFPASRICTAFDDWTVEELERAGFFACECGSRPAVMIYAPWWMSSLQVERWHGEEGEIRAMTDGLRA